MNDKEEQKVGLENKEEFGLWAQEVTKKINEELLKRLFQHRKETLSNEGAA